MNLITKMKIDKIIKNTAHEIITDIKAGDEDAEIVEDAETFQEAYWHTLNEEMADVLDGMLEEVRMQVLKKIKNKK